MNNCLTVSWLCSNIEVKEGECIKVKDLKNKYEEICSQKNWLPLNDNVLCKYLFQIFPDIKRSRGRSEDDSRYLMYVGITWKTRRSSEIITPMGVTNYLNHDGMLSSSSLSAATVLVMSETVSNGNIVMKEICLNFTDFKWGLKVRGNNICLEDFGISSHFDCTGESFREIMEIVKKMKLCVGIEIIEKKAVPIHIIYETISLRGEECKCSQRMRTKTCNQILSWLSTGESCQRCIKNLDKFKNDDDEFINMT